MKITKKQTYILTFLVWGAFTVWWIGLHTFLHPQFNNIDNSVLEWFSDTYGLMALIGALVGFNISKDWGGFRSYIGRAIIMFSLGLLLQEFGQLSYSA